jgi:hypothetical protein
VPIFQKKQSSNPLELREMGRMREFPGRQKSLPGFPSAALPFLIGTFENDLSDLRMVRENNHDQGQAALPFCSP